MEQVFINQSDWFSIISRLFVALLIGGAIGLERQLTNLNGRGAGIRTYMLISVGSALFLLMPMQLPDNSSANAISRTLQGVTTGVGFIGGGLILQQSRPKLNKSIIKGLTSAATIWVTAALGAIAGCGLWETALVGCLFTLLILSLRGTKKIKKGTLSRTILKSTAPSSSQNSVSNYVSKTISTTEDDKDNNDDD